MKQVFNKDGKIVVEEVPPPTCEDNEVLVRNVCSLISAGTETASLQSTSTIPQIALRAAKQPELVQKAVDMAKKDGLGKTIRAVRGQTGNLSPLGYSSCGVVIEVGKNIMDISAGDRVACAGTGYANHAEVVSVPRNLCCKIPADVDWDEAAFTTIGAIAMQGVRRAKIEFGDNVVVVGLGLLGQIACQILKAAGAHVIGIDMMDDRVALAKELGADVCFTGGNGAVKNVMKYTDGIGADAVIIYAATRSSDPVNQAMEMSRRKGRVVVVGAVGMELERSPFYEKEIDFMISTSYGPGRYDRNYEEKGIDYPVGYVRWTENRNMQEFLRMVASKKINVKRLINERLPAAEAVKAFELLGSEKRPIGVVLEYNEIPLETQTRTQVLKQPATGRDRINVALIGAGSFAQAYHLPNLKKLSDYHLKAIATKTGNKGKNIATEYGADYFTTDYREILRDPDVDMVLIATRHNLHAPIIVEAANAKKHVFVEKPVAMTIDECRQVYEAVKVGGAGFTVGFNRRMSPLSQKVKRLAEKRKNPLVITYRVNSAGMNKEHWINDPVEGGGAIIGEGCHFFDYCNWITDCEPERIFAESLSANDQSIIGMNNIVSTVKYTDGSIASIVYTTVGNTAFSKERIEIYFDGIVATIDDFKTLTFSGTREKDLKLSNIEKGQFELLEAYSKMLTGKCAVKDVPGIEDGIRASMCSLLAIEALKTGSVQEYRQPTG